MIDPFGCARIIEIVASAFEVPVEVLLRSRKRDVVRMRQIAMYLARKTRTISYPMIGRRFRRDHSTVMFAVQKIQRLIAENAEFAGVVESLRQGCVADMRARGLIKGDVVPEPAMQPEQVMPC